MTRHIRSEGQAILIGSGINGMARRGLLIGLGATIVVLAICVAGLWGWTLSIQKRRTKEQLQHTKKLLTATKEALSTLENEHQLLAEDYDILKSRWTKADQELERLKADSERMASQLEAKARAKGDLERELKDASAKSNRLQGELSALEREHTKAKEQSTSLAVEKAALESRLNELQATLTPAEVEQVSKTFIRQQEEQDELSRRLESLSRRYDQLLTERGQSIIQGKNGLMDIGEPSDRTQQLARVSQSQSESAARRYRELGNAHLARHNYKKAVKAFERSLTYEDNPRVHSKLAFIYDRLLSDSESAAKHAIPEISDEPDVSALDSSARSQGMPRSDWRLVWKWLTGSR